MTDLMRGYLDRVTERKRKPTDDEMRAAFDFATMRVVIHEPGHFGVDRKKYRFETAPGTPIKIEVPNDVRGRIIASYQRSGTANPTEQQIGDTYLKNKGKAGFWQ
jgi:hypothetical protein